MPSEIMENWPGRISGRKRDFRPLTKLILRCAPSDDNAVYWLLMSMAVKRRRIDIVLMASVLLFVAILFGAVLFAARPSEVMGIAIPWFGFTALVISGELFRLPIQLKKVLEKRGIALDILTVPMTSRDYAAAFLRVYLIGTAILACGCIAVLLTTLLLGSDWPFRGNDGRFFLMMVFLFHAGYSAVFWSALAGPPWNIAPIVIIVSYLVLVFSGQSSWLTEFLFSSTGAGLFFVLCCVQSFVAYRSCQSVYLDQLRLLLKL